MKKVFVIILILLILLAAGYFIFRRGLFRPAGQKDLGLTEQEIASLQEEVKDVKLKVDFGDVWVFETTQTLSLNGRTPLAFLIENKEEIRGEIGPLNRKIDLYIRVNEDNSVKAIGDYPSNDKKQWNCYLNQKKDKTPWLTKLKSSDQVEWKYEDK